MTIECEQKGGYHITNGHIFMEVVDRKTWEPVAPGEIGIMSLPSLLVGLSPYPLPNG
jgi:phenylacetate-coenzyme A ligase PaaK-like adenylate-forming protein